MNKKNECQLFFTADTHFGHGNIIKYTHRPFLAQIDKDELSRIGAWHNGDWKGKNSSDWRMSNESIHMMNETLIKEINDVVGENDTLWHLGDWCFAPKHDYYKMARYYRDRILCRNIYFVWGNHDNYSIRDLFNDTFSLTSIQHNGTNIVLCHYAMAVFNKSHRGAIQLYGHSHGGAERWMDANMPGRRSLDVGVDNASKLLKAYRPFSFKEIMKFLGDKPGFGMDHHVNPNTPTEEELAP